MSKLTEQELRALADKLARETRALHPGAAKPEDGHGAGDAGIELLDLLTWITERIEYQKDRAHPAHHLMHAAQHASASPGSARGMNPILNVSNFAESMAWFEKLGWEKAWEYGDPPGFGGVHSGDCTIFLCHDGQGGRGKGSNAMTFGPTGDEQADKGVWISVWVDDVDALHRRCVEQGLDVVWPPTDMPWGAREMHVRHPDGHVFRMGHGTDEDHHDD